MSRYFVTAALVVAVALLCALVVVADKQDTSSRRARVWTMPIVAAPKDSTVRARFDRFRTKNGVQQLNVNALEIFRENIARIVAYNQLAREDHLPVARLSTTGPFAAMTREEFMATKLGYVSQGSYLAQQAKRSLESVEDVEASEQRRPAARRPKAPAKKPSKPPKPGKKPAQPVRPSKPDTVGPNFPSTEPIPPRPVQPVQPVNPNPPVRPVVVEPIAPPQPPPAAPKPPPPTFELDAGAVDWRKQNVLLPAVNQGNCGSCWAFSACATLESRFALRDKVAPIKLSEQHMLDCFRGGRSAASAGCEGGGSYITAMNFVRDVGTIYASAYPYKGEDGNCTAVDKSNIAGYVKNRMWIKNNYNAVIEAVKRGPVSAGVEASSAVWMHYKNGVIMSTDCDVASYGVNHAINIVGYGTFQGVDVWIIRNSWGDKWGMNGYAFLERNAKNACGIITEVMEPVL